MVSDQQQSTRKGIGSHSLWLSRAALGFVALAALMGWGASFVGLHAYGQDQMVGFSYWTAWLVPGTFDGAAFGATLITYRASIHGRSAMRGRLLMWTFTAISSWINWIHQVTPEAQIVAAGLPVAAVAVFDVVLAEVRADHEERHGKRRLRVRPGLLLLRWVVDRTGTSGAFRRQVTAIPVSEIAGLGQPGTEEDRLSTSETPDDAALPQPKSIGHTNATASATSPLNPHSTAPTVHAPGNETAAREAVAAPATTDKSAQRCDPLATTPGHITSTWKPAVDSTAESSTSPAGPSGDAIDHVDSTPRVGDSPDTSRSGAESDDLAGRRIEDESTAASDEKPEPADHVAAQQPVRIATSAITTRPEAAETDTTGAGVTRPDAASADVPSPTAASPAETSVVTEELANVAQNALHGAPESAGLSGQTDQTSSASADASSDTARSDTAESDSDNTEANSGNHTTPPKSDPSANTNAANTNAANSKAGTSKKRRDPERANENTESTTPPERKSESPNAKSREDLDSGEPTLILPPLPDEGLKDKDKRDLARRDYQLSVEAGQPLNGGQLARRYGFSERWGRRQIDAVRAEKRQQSDSPLTVASQGS